MDKLLFSAIIGLIAGVIDIITPPFRHFSITSLFQSLFSM